jgi:threonine aldolase
LEFLQITMIVDLRSDTVTKPTPAMHQAMMQAEVGDDVFGEDPSVINLEKKCAALLGMDSGCVLSIGHHDQPDWYKNKHPTLR